MASRDLTQTQLKILHQLLDDKLDELHTIQARIYNESDMTSGALTGHIAMFADLKQRIEQLL